MNKSNIQINKIYRSIGLRIWKKSKENVQFIKLANIIEFIIIILKKQKHHKIASNLAIHILNKLNIKFKHVQKKFFFSKLRKVYKLHNVNVHYSG